MPNSLMEKDAQSLQELIVRLQGCSHRAALREIFESLLLPLLNAESALYAWTDSNLLQPRLIDCINIPPKDVSLIKKFLQQDPMAGYLLTHSSPVVARDIHRSEDMPLPVDPFMKGKSRVQKGYSYFGVSHPGHLTLALRDLNLGAGIHRSLKSEKPWSMRDVHLAELLRPHLLMSIKTIVLTEELAKHRSIVEVLADSPTAIALVDEDLEITYSNRTWNESLVFESGKKLPKDLTVLLAKEKYKADPLFDIEKAEEETTHYQFGDQSFQLSFTPVRGLNGASGESWLLQLKPWIEPDSKLDDLMRQAGLTKREREACSLIRQGIDLDEIANQLFISPHTVRTHLKRIHQKLGVHSRAQLMATLNP